MNDYEEGKRLAREERHTTNQYTLNYDERRGFDDQIESENPSSNSSNSYNSSSSSSSSSSAGSNPIAVGMAIGAALAAMMLALGAKSGKGKLGALFIALETIALTIILAAVLWNVGWGLAITIAVVGGLSYFLANKAGTWTWFLTAAVVLGWLALVFSGQPILGLIMAGLSAGAHYLFHNDQNRSLVIGRVVMKCSNAENYDGACVNGENTRGITLTIEDGPKTRTITPDDRGFFTIASTNPNAEYKVTKIHLLVQTQSSRAEAWIAPDKFFIVPTPAAVYNLGLVEASWDAQSQEADWNVYDDSTTEEIFKETKEYKAWKHNDIID